MGRNGMTWGIAVVVVLATCKKEPAEEDPGPPSAPAAEEPAAREETPVAPSPARTSTPAPSPDGNPSEPNAPATTGRTPEAPPPAPPTPAQTSPSPLPAPSRTPPGPVPKTEAKTPLSDVRLLLTAADVSEVAGPKVEFQRTVLPGFESGDDRQALYFEPTRGGEFGFAIQVFREQDGRAARQRFEQAFATYPNAVEVAPVAGSSFFAYWGEVLHVGFLQPHGNLVVVVSCGRKYCDSDALYALAKKANSRIR